MAEVLADSSLLRQVLTESAVSDRYLPDGFRGAEIQSMVQQ